MSDSNNYTTHGNNLILSNAVLTFAYPIGKCLNIDNMLIVILAVPVNENYGENVFGVNLLKARLQWQIEKRIFGLERYQKMKCFYHSIAYFDNKLRLNNWCDTYLIVDPLTGSVLEEGEMR